MKTAHIAIHTVALFLAGACTQPESNDTDVTIADPSTEPFVGKTLVEPLWIATQSDGADLEEPNELAFDPSGRLWAGDVERLAVDIFDLEGDWIATIGGEGDEPGQFSRPDDDRKFGPESIHVNEEEAFVVDRGGRRIHVYDTETFAWIRTLNSPRLMDPTGLAIDSQQTLYVADQELNAILVFSPDGSYLSTFQTIDSSGAPILRKTETLALIEDLDLAFATSEDEALIEVFVLSTGAYTGHSIGDSQDGPVPEKGRYADDIEGIAIDPHSGLLYTSDEENGRVMVHDLEDLGTLFSPEQDFGFLTAFGTRGALPGQLKSADGITVARDGRIAIADQGNHRLQVFDDQRVLSD